MSPDDHGQHPRWRLPRSLLTVVQRRTLARQLPPFDWLEAAEEAHNASFPLYGLGPSWRGTRYLGDVRTGLSRGTRITLGVELMHGHPGLDDGVAVSVRTEPPSPPDAATVRSIWLPDHLADRLRAQPALFHELTRNFREGLDVIPDAEWQDQEVRIDDGLKLFRALTVSTESWVLNGSPGGAEVTVQGWRFPIEDVHLVEITDLRPYL